MTNRDDLPVTPSQQYAPAGQSVGASPQPANVADLLLRVLDKGIVIAGDITLTLGAIELLTLRIRLLIASVDKAQEIGIDWWKSDPALSSQARNRQLEDRIERLEAMLDGASQGEPLEGTRDTLDERLKRLETRLASEAIEEQGEDDQESNGGS